MSVEVPEAKLFAVIDALRSAQDRTQRALEKQVSRTKKARQQRDIYRDRYLRLIALVYNWAEHNDA